MRPAHECQAPGETAAELVRSGTRSLPWESSPWNEFRGRACGNVGLSPREREFEGGVARGLGASTPPSLRTAPCLRRRPGPARLLERDAVVQELLESQPRLLLGDDEAPRVAAVVHVSRWGGMPASASAGSRSRWPCIEAAVLAGRLPCRARLRCRCRTRCIRHARRPLQDLPRKALAKFPLRSEPSGSWPPGRGSYSHLRDRNHAIIAPATTTLMPQNAAYPHRHSSSGKWRKFMP